MKKMFPSVFSGCLMLTVCCLVLTGCGKSYPGGEKLYPVTVTVMDSGKPVSGAIINFDRQSGTKISTGGLTDANGKAIIKVDAEWEGAPEGSYMVRILKEPSFTPDLSDEEYAKLRPDLQEEYNNKMLAKRSQLKPVVPSVLSGDKSPLKMDVTSGTNEATFDIAEHW